MDDLIRKKSVLKIIGDIWLSCSDYGLGIDHFYEEVVSAIENELPSVQPKVGHWELDEHLDKIGMIYKYNCSECGEKQRAMYDYCPSCGSFNGGDTCENSN